MALNANSRRQGTHYGIVCPFLKPSSWFLLYSDGATPAAAVKNIYDAVQGWLETQLVLLHLLNAAFAGNLNFARVSIQDLQKITQLTKYRIHKALAHLTDAGAISLIHRNTKGTLYLIDLIDESLQKSGTSKEARANTKIKQYIKTEAYENLYIWFLIDFCRNK